MTATPEKKTAVDIVHEVLASSGGCHHPKYAVPACERVVLALQARKDLK